MKFNDLNKATLFKIEHYTDNCERLIELPVGLFGRRSTMRKFSIKRDKQDRINVDTLRESVSRSKRNIRRICLSNDFQYFATWTISSQFADRFSLQDVEHRMHYLLREYQRLYPDFKYIYVIEKHQDGAFHFHGMVKNMPDFVLFRKDDFQKLPYYILDTIDKRKKIFYSKYFFDKLGWCTFTKINNYEACCNYIIKYISKDPVRNENDQVYFCSRGLVKCISEEYRTYIPERFLRGAYSHTYKRINPDTLEEEEVTLCRVKDIYRDTFNKNTKIDYILATTDRNYVFG